jgi:CLIP-associating protein 1/2
MESESIISAPIASPVFATRLGPLADTGIARFHKNRQTSIANSRRFRRSPVERDMTEKLTDQQVADLLALLKKDVSVDSKVQQVNAIKSGIKQHNVPDACVAPLFEALRLASSSQHSVLINAGFTALNHLLTRLSRQDPKYLSKEAKHTLPLVVEKLGDQKDKLRSLALQAMTTMYQAAPIDAERFVRNVAMIGKNNRAKESGMQWLLQVREDFGIFGCGAILGALE